MYVDMFGVWGASTGAAVTPVDWPNEGANMKERKTVSVDRPQVDFGAALQAMKTGRRVSRSGWNGKGMWIAIVHPINPSITTDPSRPSWGLMFPIEIRGDSPYMTSRSLWPRNPAGPYQLLPFIGMKTADGGFVPWLASQTDMLAEDWEVLEEVP